MQLTLPSFDLPARWPLVPVSVAAFFLDRAPEEIRLQSDSVWAWDIASPERDRREVRIWRQSLLALRTPALKVAGRHDAVLEKFLPRRGLRGTELQNLFFCTAQHIAELDAAGLLVVERDRLAASGPRASRLYTRASVAQFLTARVLGALPSAARN